MNWGEKLFGKNLNLKDMFFIEVEIDMGPVHIL
jgi:hypothetical protein